MYLQGKVAVISGGARGLGRAYTEAILKAGGKVPIRSNLYIVTVKYISHDWINVFKLTKYVLFRID